MGFGEFLLNLIFNVLVSFVNLILTPFDAIIERFLPSFDNVLNSFNIVINYLSDIIYFVLGWVHIPPVAISLFVGYILFLIGVYTFKIAVKIHLQIINIFHK